MKAMLVPLTVAFGALGGRSRRAACERTMPPRSPPPPAPVARLTRGSWIEYMRAAPLLLALLAMPSVADEWVYAAGSKNFDVALQVSGLKRNNRGTVIAWTRWHYKKPQRDNRGRTYTNTLQEDVIDCRSRSSGIKKMINYNAAGDVVWSQSVDSVRLESVAPDTVAEAILEEVCSRV